MNDLQRQFIRAFESHCEAFDVSLSTEKVFALARYCELVEEHNKILHLVAPMPVEDFVVRHILESIYAEKFLPKNARFADIGTGAGLPAVPILIARQDTRGVLIESKLKKANFLVEVLAKCRLESRAEIGNRQFEELEKPDVSYVLCRALDKFTRKLPKLLKWSGNCRLLLFGGDALRLELEKNAVKFEAKLLPLSEQRFLFVSQK
ncbi:MAG: class I SAM-dependent methyltransferase [Acidobacteriota bacterium]|nr:class I SAM-dependent methyltransferase [Acidobacteriota bacterium]